MDGLINLVFGLIYMIAYPVFIFFVVLALFGWVSSWKIWSR